MKRTQECINCIRPETTGISCTTCRSTNAVDRLLIASDYRDPLLSHVIQVWKYQFVQGLTHPLVALLKKQLAYLVQHRKFNALSSSPLVVPVPLVPYRERWRGFNQSYMLARDIADTFQLKLAPVLVRTRTTPAQALIEDRITRLANVTGAFICTPSTKLNQADILLIDDVCTTGATLDACARSLKVAGAKSVTALVIARG